MFKKTPILFFVLAFLGTQAALAQEPARSSENDPVLREYLRQYPEADTDQDGVLSTWEHDAHLPAEFFKDIKGKREHIMLPMRDGVRLATEIFLPGGDEKRPAILIRTGYGRLGVARYAVKWLQAGCVVVSQDPRGDGSSEGAEAIRNSNAFDHEIPDSYDTIDWISKQAWSNGRVGTVGGSGHGMASTLGKWNGHPAFIYSATSNSVGHWMHWQFHNGVRRQTYGWLGSFQRVVDKQTPGTMSWNWEAWHAYQRTQAPDTRFVYVMDGGWYDPFLESDLESFQALQASGRAYVTIGPRGHGGISGLKPVPKESIHPTHRQAAPRPDMLSSLREGLPEATGSQLRYYLMGDVQNPDAPGNVWRNTAVWPVENETVEWFLSGESGLTTGTALAGARAFRYDPNDPAPSLGGHYAWGGDVSGPWDQSSLLAREDVLLFQSEVLNAPFIITGPMQARIVFSTDVEDTSFVLKLVDVYPDGTHALVKETAGMARYYAGWNQPGQAIEPGKKYALELDWGATAYAFDAGHRLAILLTGASTPAYQLHPNRFEPVQDLAGAPVATTHIYSGPEGSRIRLPRVDDDGR